ncbi:hypothetical protein FS837_001368, partial [Tulasnella sp. UAMH 9824]
MGKRLPNISKVQTPSSATRIRMTSQKDPIPQASRVDDGARRAKHQGGLEYFQEANYHADTPPRPQEAEPSSELVLGRKHNAALPIHSLPAEVLFQVIHLHLIHTFLGVWDQTGYYPRLIELSGVCSHWYNVIRDSPPLWTQVCRSDPLRVVEMVLQRSSCHPLAIIIDQEASQSTPELRAFMEFISLHKDRWQNMNIRVPRGCMEEMIEALGGPPPNLEKLSFIDRDTMACSQEYDLFGGRAPRLINCTLDGVSIR